MAEKLPRLDGPRGSGPRLSHRLSRGETIVHEDPQARVIQLFAGRDEQICRYCKTPLLNPRFKPVEGARALAIPVAHSLALVSPTTINGFGLSCICCAIERDPKTLIDFLERGDIMVLAWTSLTPSEAPSASTVVEYLRLVYGYMALVDRHQGNSPSYKPLLRDAEIQAMAALRLYGLTFDPIWSATPDVRTKVDHFIHSTRFPIPLPKPKTPLAPNNASPGEQAWLRHAWSALAASDYDAWAKLRPYLLLLPSPSLAHNPNAADLEARIRAAAPDDLDPTSTKMLNLAGIAVNS